MRERRGAIGRATELAESVVAGVKRRQAARAPKVLLYDADGRPRTIDADAAAGTALVGAARELVEIAGPDDLTMTEVPEEE